MKHSGVMEFPSSRNVLVLQKSVNSKKSHFCAPQPYCQSPDSEVKVHGVQRVPGYIMSNTAQVLLAVKACQVAFWDVNAGFRQHRNVFAGVLPLTPHGIDAKP